jgi:ketol-acid reductoisomerase
VIKKEKFSMQEQAFRHWDRICIIGLGSQGLAWASNLTDSSRKVDIFLRAPTSYQNILDKKKLKLASSLEVYDLLLLLIPDDQHASFLKENINKIKPGTSIIYGHGASMVEHNLNEKYPKLNHILLAPKAIASEVRFQYENSGKLGAVYSTEFTDNLYSKEIHQETLKLAKDLGITAGPFETSFYQEACADLFSEQSLLCGLIPHAAKHSFDALLARGFAPELAYMECWLEVKLIADTMVKKGPSGLFDLISPHALKGSELAQKRFFDKEYHKTLERLLSGIEDGSFFKEANAIDAKELKNKYREYWSSSKLQLVHDKLKEDLVP